MRQIKAHTCSRLLSNFQQAISLMGYSRCYSVSNLLITCHASTTGMRVYVLNNSCSCRHTKRLAWLASHNRMSEAQHVSGETKLFHIVLGCKRQKCVNLETPLRCYTFPPKMLKYFRRYMLTSEHQSLVAGYIEHQTLHAICKQVQYMFGFQDV